jgi:two-component system cell cycle response regulator DivK
MILEREGAKIGFERWGREDTIKRLQEFAPVDLILLDLMFPRGISGYEIFDMIRCHQAFAHVPIIAVSASAASIEIPKTKAKGFAGFISKPVRLQTFPAQILAFMNAAQLSQ